MLARFRVATTATGIRRQVFVHIYQHQHEMAEAVKNARGEEPPHGVTIGGALDIQQSYQWPQPEQAPIVVMRLWIGQLTAHIVAHEATHAAAAFYFMDCVRSWDSRARHHLRGDHEPLAYLVGDITSEVNDGLHRLGLLLQPQP